MLASRRYRFDVPRHRERSWIGRNNYEERRPSVPSVADFRNPLKSSVENRLRYLVAMVLVPRSPSIKPDRTTHPGEAQLVNALRRCAVRVDNLRSHAVEVDTIDQHPKASLCRCEFVPILVRTAVKLELVRKAPVSVPVSSRNKICTGSLATGARLRRQQ